MPWCRYTREILLDAVAVSTSIAGVLRHLGLPPNGGSHAHLRRRIDHFGIDTSHFFGRAHRRDTPSERRRPARDVLVLRPPQQQRAAPRSLRRALMALGRPYRCEGCGVDGTWNGRELTLQVDHIDGCYWDCRPANLRFLCPNCHSQTATHAGRNRSRFGAPLVRVDDRGGIVADAAPVPLRRDELSAVLHRVTSGELGVADAARLAGCHRNTIHRWRKAASDGMLPAARPRARPVATTHRDAVIDFALRHPTLGSRKVASALRELPTPVLISHGTVATILAAAGLNTSAARLTAATAGSQAPVDRLD